MWLLKKATCAFVFFLVFNLAFFNIFFISSHPFSKIDNNQNFYFSENGNIVIVFDKYEVGPGSSGAPEFEIDKSIYERYLKK